MTANGGDNIVSAGIVNEEGYGNGKAINALAASEVTITALGGINSLAGAIDGRNTDTNISLESQNNIIQSTAVITDAGDLNDDRKVISSLYAEDGAQISISGHQNVIRTYAENPADPNTLERAIWAYDKADITIDGQTYISTDRYEETDETQKGNSADIAIAAGTAVNLDETMVNAPVEDRASVNINYDSYTDANGNTVQSYITGDILSAYAGEVNITPKNDTAQIHITGNILAGNNGVLNVNLGNGGTLTGRADDYGDAGVVTNSEHTTFFDPAFSSAIYKGGEVNLTMGEGSRWNVTGQSWITTVDTTGSSNALIDLVSANTERNSSAHALTIYDMKGDATFNMSLDADRSVSDMVYMKHADGSYLINVIDPITQQDMYADRSDGGVFDGLRFATVGKGSSATFRAMTIGAGVNNIEYEVGTDDYAGNDENHHYDSAIGGAGNTEKPGTDLVEGFFENDGTPGVQTASANGVMMMAARANESLGTDTGLNGTQVEDTTNYKLIGVKSTDISNAGKTVVAMSKVNYSNAIYMDRLNKRMGEARYIDGDEGLWVRMRHDRIGKSDAFRSKNTMFELGYDRKVGDREDGEHRQGVVFDYMRGTADYHNVAGEGDVRRGGVWFYDTWLGNKGHYTDYVLKFGRLSNDFDIYSELGEKITGDYSNFVYSASAEYGRKKSLGGDWYIEPQAQLQYAHVTDADYTTSQGTSVQLDAIDSLIGRVGFRLGKDVSDTSTFYIKADVLHEFLGDQDISAFDETGRLDTTYENEGTWYDVGLGFSHQFSKGTYMFLDVEKTFGNDNEDTYQFNVGMNWKV
ncbi:autotransporter outer membrane beta-barrel domain-containing protein [Megasphaera sp. ASD88]|uniref:autotransporter outer membrane beta-barrel domain-containing protein n=1 Tax=Megasphaera sp. ASD88 TaxID=2027407 RepID=UPI001E505D69|nr:autotransporter outer membrane beta-barrel domain-containing protein [Megasphaera sp. ASD88]